MSEAVDQLEKMVALAEYHKKQFVYLSNQLRDLADKQKATTHQLIYLNDKVEKLNTFIGTEITPDVDRMADHFVGDD